MTDTNDTTDRNDRPIAVGGIGSVRRLLPMITAGVL